MITVIIFILAALIFSAVILSIVMLVPGRNPVPVEVSRDTARKHIALIYLIRGGELLVGVPLFALIALIILGGMFATNPFPGPGIYRVTYTVVMVLAFLAVVTGITARYMNQYLKIGGGTFLKKFPYIDTNSVGNFAFIFAAFASHDVYHLLPPSNPATIRAHPGLTGLIFDRDISWIIVFLLIWMLTKPLLRHLLELNPPAPPHHPPSDPPPDTPEFPQKSPLIPL